ncbi:WhiB family transcriptional regulator [Streptomyces desertarenae]|uniref:Transcriptional regulator WhiB n=1 Tax=Streptomyces desertarenae TaxID=2666184 RepID=A0ABW4PQC3_9ACTN
MPNPSNTPRPNDPPTANHAACTTPGVDPDLWFSDHPTDRTRAKRLCAGCPLLDPCRAYGLDTDQLWGVWGGLDRADRRRILRGVVCGTETALKIHRRYGERCTVCETAHDRRVETRRRQSLAAAHARGGTAASAQLHRKLGEPVCAPCRRAELAAEEARRRARGIPPRDARTGDGRTRGSGTPSVGAHTTAQAA